MVVLNIFVQMRFVIYISIDVQKVSRKEKEGTQKSQV
jgi:hypothetical protein